MLEFLLLVLFKVNAVSDNDEYSLVMTENHHLSENQKWRIIDRIKGGQTQRDVVQNLNSHQSVIPRAWSRFLSIGSTNRQHSK